MKVKALNNVAKLLKEHCLGEFLTAGKTYTVIGISLDHYRVINDCGEPILFPNDVFEIIEHDIPSDWITIKEINEDGDEEYYVDPPGFGVPGFYEDYFDDIPVAVESFELFRKLNKLPPRITYNQYLKKYPNRFK